MGANKLVSYFAMVLLVMIGIFAIKKVNQMYSIPVIGTVIEEV